MLLLHSLQRLLTRQTLCLPVKLAVPSSICSKFVNVNPLLTRCMTTSYLHAIILLDVQEVHQHAHAADRLPADPACPISLIKTLQYLPQALQYIACSCKHLQELSLRLSQAASNNKGGAWDHPSLLKRPHFKLSQFCSQCTTLQSLVLVNIPSRYAFIESHLPA